MLLSYFFIFLKIPNSPLLCRPHGTLNRFNKWTSFNTVVGLPCPWIKACISSSLATLSPKFIDHKNYITYIFVLSCVNTHYDSVNQEKCTCAMSSVDAFLLIDVFPVVRVLAFQGSFFLFLCRIHFATYKIFRRCFSPKREIWSSNFQTETGSMTSTSPEFLLLFFVGRIWWAIRKQLTSLYSRKLLHQLAHAFLIQS